MDDLSDKFRNVKVSTDHINNQIMDKYGHKIKTDELSINKAKTNKDKANRATVENVLDPRTMRFLNALVNRGVIAGLNGCLSTGKEANVYHAFAGSKMATEQQSDEPKEDLNVNAIPSKGTIDNSENRAKTAEDLIREGRKEYAIKIYKTSILIFKDRERYVDGEFRFRNSRSQHNPRKMIKIWAEKEFRNLKRIYQMGVIPSPEPIEVKNNVLVMEFLNRGDGFASPKLRDYPYKDREEIYYYYHILVSYMRLLYQVCRLVHADLSEYNTIVHKEKLYMIDVSQSVEPEHPMSLDFLRMDIKNVNLYFEKMGIEIFQEKAIFQFVITDTLDKFDGDMNSYEDLRKYVATNIPIKRTQEDEAEDEVFRSLHLVRSLEGLEERDFDRFTDGKFDLLKSLLAQDNKKNYIAAQASKINVDSSDENISDSDDEGSDEGSDDDTDGSDEEEQYSEAESYEEVPKELKGKKYEDKDLKKQRKQEAKEAKREKRKTKVKKHIKKKLVNKTKSKK
ncbi:RIO1 family [Nakaseomyces glabratus]